MEKSKFVGSPENLLAIAVSVFILGGRWSLSRILELDPAWYLEPRVFALVLLILICMGKPGLRNHIIIPSEERYAKLLAIASLAVLAFSFFWSLDSQLSIEKFYEISLIILFAAFLPQSFKCVCREEFAEKLFSWSKSILLVLACTSLLTGLSLDRVNSLGGGPNVFGRLMGLLFVLGLEQYNARKRNSDAIAAAFGGLLVIASGSRGALLSTLFTFLLWLWIRDVKINRLFRLSFNVFVIVLVFVNCTAFGQRIVEIFYFRIVETTIEQGHVSGRDFIYEKSLQIGLDHPVFGAGLNAVNIYGYGVNPHNVVLEFFSEAGGVGLFVFLSYLFVIVFTKLYCNKQPVVILFCWWVLILVSSMFSGDIYDSRGIFCLGVLMSMWGDRTNWKERL